MAFPEPVRTRPADIKIVTTTASAVERQMVALQMTVADRNWGDDDGEVNAAHVNMRYARERRTRVVNSVEVINHTRGVDEAEPNSEHAFPGRRVWAGIGGFLYIPSFPQLRRKETTWPDAT